MEFKKMNDKAQIEGLVPTAIGIVIFVAVLGVGYSLVTGLAASQTTNSISYNATIEGYTLLDTVKDNAGILVLVTVFVLILGGVAMLGRVTGGGNQ